MLGPLVGIGAHLEAERFHKDIHDVIESEHRYLTDNLSEAETITMLLPELDLIPYLDKPSDLSKIVVALASYSFGPHISEEVKRSSLKALEFIMKSYNTPSILSSMTTALQVIPKYGRSRLIDAIKIHSARVEQVKGDKDLEKSLF